MLKPQDILVVTYLSLHDEPWTYPSLALGVGVSTSEAHASVRRAGVSRLYDPSSRRVLRAPLFEFISHGLAYVYPVERGQLTRGIPTAHAAPPLCEFIRVGEGEVPPVWPDPEGTTRGEAWSPLYSSVPAVARRDPALYEALALIDAIRGGRARERALAINELTRRLR